MRDYPTLHLDTNWGKETACFKKGYGCNEHKSLSNVPLL
jgi:hypothetical protein